MGKGMRFSNSPVVEVAVNGELLRFEQDNESKQVGTSVWPCSLLLLKWLEHRLSVGDAEFDVRGKNGVELGAGCGVAGLGFSLLGLHTTLTDIAPVLPSLKRNVEKNVASTSLQSAGKPHSSVGKVEIAQLHWGDAAEIAALKPPFDFIIAADVIYLEDSVEPLLSTLSALAGPSTTILLGYQMRSPEAHKLFWKLCPLQFRVRMIPHIDLHPDYAFNEANVYVLRKS